MGPEGVYTMFRLEDRDVAAAYALQQQPDAQGVPPNWMIYVAVASADETAARCTELGGKVVAGPFDVFDFGRMAVLQDPTGAHISIWQASKHKGAGISEVPGTACWADLNTPDPDRAKQFYGDLFGWKFDAGDKDLSGYLHIVNGEKMIGGLPPAAHQNPNIPPHWLTYFLVTDCDAITEKAKSMGGRALFGPMTMEKVGRMATLADPQVAVFALYQPE
jgi:predicted enzyme related to lactoylglutathione lyase